MYLIGEKKVSAKHCQLPVEIVCIARVLSTIQEKVV